MIAPPDATAHAAPSTAPPPAHGARAAGDVLLVHADAALHAGMGSALVAAGFAIVAIESAERALCLGPQHWAAAVLQTREEQAEATHSLCHALRAHTPGLPLLQLTGAARRSPPLAGVDACLCETTPAAALAATVQSLVRAHHAEEQLRQQQAASSARQALAHQQAHALRNPLNAILLSAQVLSSMPLTPAARRAVDAICRNAQTQADLISDALAPARRSGNGTHP